MTIDEVTTNLIASYDRLDDTVDALMTGDPRDTVTGIATVFMPTYSVLQNAAATGLNLVIAHEAPFYHHRDDRSALADDPVLAAKQALIDQSGLAIFRWHDHMHRFGPDAICAGMVRDLGWESYVDEADESHRPLKFAPLTIPPATVETVVRHIKARLDVPWVRIVGEPSMQCTRVGLLPGYCGGGSLAIPYFRDAQLDLIVTGEGPEWETPEYVRDAVAAGFAKALVVVGHSRSEFSGMKYLAEALALQYPEIRVEYLPDPQLFQWL